VALALYRKYRPATFADVVGQEHVTEPLRTALAAGRINHAYLFSGPRGCGKTSSARILARSLNCEQGPTPDPCGVCASCVALAPEGPGSLDVVELDAASHGGVDDTRELRDRAFYMPAESRYRVFIIDEAHMVTTQGFNALLKIVEEPPEHLVFVFATTEPDKVLPTIRSRTHHYPFRLLPPATLRGLLERLCAEEGVTVEPAVFPLVVRAGAGSARDALSVMDQLLAGAGPDGVRYASAVALLGVTDAALLDEMVDALAAGDGASVFGAVDRVAEAGHDPRRFGADLLQRLRDLVILQAVPDAVSKGLIDAPDDQLAAMTAQAERLPTATLTRFAEILHTGLTDMRGTTSPRLVLELLCARMLLPAASLEDGALLQRLERVERRLEIAAEHGGDGPSGDGRSTGDGTRGDRRVTAPAPAAPAAPGSERATARAGSGTGGAPPSAAAAPDRAAATAAGPSAGAAAPSADPAAGTPSAAAASPSAKRTAGPDLGLPEPPVLSGSRGRTSPAEKAEPDPAERPPAAHEDATGAPPATAAPAGPAGSERSDVAVGVTDVRRVWTEILAAVKRQRRTTQVLLESATVAGVDGATLLLTMPSAALARRVLESGNTDVLRSALREVLGVDWRIRCDAAGSAGAGPSDGGPPPPGPAGGGPVAGPSAGRAPEPAAGASDRRADDAGADGVPPEPVDRDEPDPYDDIDPAAPTAAVQDPEQAAMELLAARLGARRLDQQG
jgi:DNA polymerase-3 subunit gamma/tau